MKISNLEPKSVFKYFDAILQIPRPSKQEEKIIAFLENFASENNLDYTKDDAGNLLIRKPASKGMEKIQSVALQSHVDMVCEKNSNIEHNFTSDAIPAYVDGDWIRSKGTTLGADNGIGVAVQLAVLADKKLQNGPIECLFTIDEETGLTGAFKLSKDLLKSNILINLDSEDEGEIFIGCAGGIDTLINLPVRTKNSSKKNKAFKVSITGLKGGHSGDDINKGFANSNLLLTRFLWNSTRNFKIQLADFQGGNLRNAIPREAEATFLIKPKQEPELMEYLGEFSKTLQSEYAITEPDLKIEISETKRPNKILKSGLQDKFLCSVYSCPNGVIAMSQSMPGLVETSTNLASIHFSRKMIQIVTSQRSSIESAKVDLADRIKSNFYLAGAKVIHSDGYPGWAPKPDSAILSVAQKVYHELFNKKAKIKAIHAGLECGLFLEKYPALEMISVGPTMKGVHSPDERLQISSVEKFYVFLVKLLENIPE